MRERGIEGEGRGSKTARGNNTQRRTRQGRRRQKRVLKCMTINAQSLKNKMNEFRTLVEKEKPQIMSITESWGEEWIRNSDIP